MLFSAVFPDHEIRSVTVNGRTWKEFNPEKEVVELAGLTARAVVVTRYWKSRVG
jgi:hypothetical protein